MANGLSLKLPSRVAMASSVGESKGLVEEQAADDPFLHVQGLPIYFSEDWSTGIGGGLWSTGRMMAHFFATEQARRMILGSSDNHDFTVMELGSGNGLLSVCLLALARQNIKHLVVTDLADHLPLIRQTIASNPQIIDQQVSSKVIVMEHKWGCFARQSQAEPSVKAQVQQASCQFDIIFGSDVAYHPSLYDPLILSLQAYSHEKTVALIGITMLDTTVAFFDKLRNAGFCYERIPDVFVELEEFRGTTFGLFIVRRQKPRAPIQFCDSKRSYR